MKKNWVLTVRYHNDMSGKAKDDTVLIEDVNWWRHVPFIAKHAGRAK